MFRADIADALVARGDVARASLVLQRHCQLLIREAWWHLAAVLLPKLLHCQKLLLQVVTLCSSILHCSRPSTPHFAHQTAEALGCHAVLAFMLSWLHTHVLAPCCDMLSTLMMKLVMQAFNAVIASYMSCCMTPHAYLNSRSSIDQQQLLQAAATTGLMYNDSIRLALSLCRLCYLQPVSSYLACRKRPGTAFPASRRRRICSKLQPNPHPPQPTPEQLVWTAAPATATPAQP